MGIIILIASFDNIGVTEKVLGDFAGENNTFKSFEPDWYMDYGNKICIFIFMSAFLINSSDIVAYIKKETARLYDRRGKMNLKLDPDDEDCDLPNTR
jgi:hypothetical protein